MADVLHPITSCLKQSSTMEKKDNLNPKTLDESNEILNSNSPNSEAQPGIIWRVSSGLYNIGSGAVGIGVGSVKWAASTTYSVGTGVVSATQNVVSKVTPGSKIKSKKE